MNTTILNFVGLPLDVEYRCRINRVPGGEVAQCVAELKQVGFYRYTLPENLEKALCDPLESLDDYGYVFFDYINRDTRMDTEDINECGIGEFLKDIRNFPPCHIITSTFINEEYQGRVNHVKFSGIECKVWVYTEFEDTHHAWLLSGDRAIKMMNQLFEINGYEDRLYYYHAGNDSEAFLVTPQILKVLTRYGAMTINTK